MHLSRNLLSGKRKYLFGSILLMFISVICVALSLEDSDNFDISRREVLLRRIGHELLLQSGDSTSRVLPVEKTAENEYRIRYQPGQLLVLFVEPGDIVIEEGVSEELIRHEVLRIDLAKKYPEKLEALKSLFDEDAKKYHVYPFIDWDDVFKGKIHKGAIRQYSLPNK